MKICGVLNGSERTECFARARKIGHEGARIDHGEHVSFSRADRVLVSSLARLEPVFFTIDATTKFLLDCWRTGRLLFVVVFSLTIGASEGAPGRGESNVGAGRFNPRLATSPVAVERTLHAGADPRRTRERARHRCAGCQRVTLFSEHVQRPGSFIFFAGERALRRSTILKRV